MESKYLVVVADGRARQRLAEALRRRGIPVTLAQTGAEAERVVRNVSVGTVLAESHLPDTSAEELRDRLKEIRPECRFVQLTSFNLVRNSPELLRFGRDDYLLHSDQLLDLLKVSKDAEAADLGLWPWEERGTQALLQVIDVLVGLLELEHKSFPVSSHQAMQLARATAEELGCDDESIHEIVLGTLLRDVGFAGIEPEDQVPEESTDEDSTEERHHRVAAHVSASFRLFEHIGFPWKVLPIVRHHHECYDGSGAPDGLRGREIPMGARIVAVVDGYLQLTGGRGQDPVGPDEAFLSIVCRAGHEYDPEVIEAFQRVLDKRLAGRRSEGKPTVLLVDSDKDFRRLLKMRLSNEDLNVREAADYAKCLKSMRKNSPDLVMVEIDADPPAAFELLLEMQQDEALCRIPLVFVSQRSDRLQRIRALRQGVDDFLCKADDVEELVTRVQNILVRQAVRASGPKRRSRRGISGDLENLALPDIIQTLTIGMKTACVSLTSGDRTGKIWFEGGAPTHAETEEMEGEQAFYEMVRWTDGEFVIEHGTKTDAASVTKDAMFLLMEGLRLMDEAGRGGPRLSS